MESVDVRTLAGDDVSPANGASLPANFEPFCNQHCAINSLVKW